MLIFKKISLKNMLSVGNDGITIDLSTYNMTCAIGKNGASKSGSITDSLFYACYGKPYRKIKLSQLINSINRKDMLVELEFSVGSNEYLIRRGQKPNIFEIFQNGILQNQDGSNTDYQEKLEKNILKMSYKNMQQVVVMGSSNFTPFMLLPALARREFIESLLNIDIFSSMNSILKTKITLNKTEISELDNNIKLTQQKIELQKKYLESLKQNNNDIIYEKESKIEEHEETIKELNIKKLELNNEINGLNETIKDHDKVQKKSRELSDIERSLEDNISGLTKEIRFLEKHDDCPTCKQGINTHFKKEAVDSKNSEIAEYRDGLSKMSELIKKNDSRLVEINEQIKKIEKVQKSLNDNSVDIRMSTRFIEQLKEEIKVLNLHNKNFEIDETETIKLKKEFDKLLENKSKLTDLREVYNTTSTLLKDGGIKTQIIKQYIPVINSLINKFLEQMDFHVSFTLDEDFNEKILSRNRDDFSFHNFSEGERMRINLAILFAWREIARMRNSSACNLLIMDEVLDSSMDTGGLEDLLRILKTLTSENIIIISHKPNEVENYFDRILEFQKVKSFSRMIETK